MALEDWLNLAWTLLAVLVLVHWAKVGAKRRDFACGFVALIFVFCLLFPIISADDDQLQIAFITDTSASQAMDAFKNAKQLRNATGPVALAEVPRVSPPFLPPAVLEPLTEQRVLQGVSVKPGATGNHSPPIA